MFTISIKIYSFLDMLEECCFKEPGLQLSFYFKIPWLFTIFQTFSTASQLPLQLSSNLQIEHLLSENKTIIKKTPKEWGQFCKFMFLKIKETH